LPWIISAKSRPNLNSSFSRIPLSLRLSGEENVFDFD
jgi:hypothetical protein